MCLLGCFVLCGQKDSGAVTQEEDRPGWNSVVPFYALAASFPGDTRLMAPSSHGPTFISERERLEGRSAGWLVCSLDGWALEDVCAFSACE